MIARWFGKNAGQEAAVEAAALRSDRFRQAREGDWQRLDAIVTRIEGGRLRKLSDEDLLALARALSHGGVQPGDRARNLARCRADRLSRRAGAARVVCRLWPARRAGRLAAALFWAGGARRCAPWASTWSSRWR
jgi:hypothetical protein